MPIFEKPPLETLTPAKDRWTPIYLEHGRLEVDDSSIKWIGADGMVYRLPVALSSPHVRGDGPEVKGHEAMENVVLPTCVGMVRGPCGCPLSAVEFSPPAWGWSAIRNLQSAGAILFSPRAWGWSERIERSACVEYRSPHVRGDGPYTEGVQR